MIKRHLIGKMRGRDLSPRLLEERCRPSFGFVTFVLIISEPAWGRIIYNNKSEEATKECVLFI